jgi:tetratricopeptide (TPR) repeat protein
MAEIPVALDALERAEPIADRLGLALERSRIHFTRGNLFFAQSNSAGCRQEHERALDYARRAGDVESEAQALSGLGDALYAQGRMLTALGYFRQCVELCEQQGLLKFEIPNRAMVGHCLQYSNDTEAGIAEVRSACDAAARTGLVSQEIMTQESLGLILLGSGRYEDAERALRRAESLARPAGARRYLTMVLYGLGCIAHHRGHSDEARQHFEEALALARQTGLGFAGPPVLGGLARLASERAERERLLREAEAVLQDECISHCYLWFYRDSIEGALELGEWDDAIRRADALEQYASGEPLPWTRLVAARARALARIGQHGMSPGSALELTRLRDEAREASFGLLLPALEAALRA